jgi:hypothetical protein
MQKKNKMIYEWVRIEEYIRVTNLDKSSENGKKKKKVQRCGNTNTQSHFRSHAKRSWKIRSKTQIFSQKKIFVTYQKHSQCWIVFVGIAASLLSYFSAKQIKINSC